MDEFWHGTADVGLVSSWTGDHVVVGELLLLDIEWHLPAQKLAAALQPPEGPG